MPQSLGVTTATSRAHPVRARFVPRRFSLSQTARVPGGAGGILDFPVSKWLHVSRQENPMSGPRATKGDAEAVLEAFGGGGWAILRHNKVVEGAPAQGTADSRVAIRPFANWNGRHFCELDWHVILVADVEPVDAASTPKDAHAAIENLTVTFTLDGAPLPVSRTAVKRFLNPQRFDLDEAFYAQWGRIMSPGELSVGAHTLSVVFEGQALPEITFFVDAAGTGACQDQP
jgi:hypothetical protein